MGIWGNEIFEDDAALDVKTSFEELIEDGVNYEEALKTVVEEYQEALADFDDGPTVVLALTSLAIEYSVGSEFLKNELDRIENDTEYWDYLKEENFELYETRIDLLKNLKIKMK